MASAPRSAGASTVPDRTIREPRARSSPARAMRSPAATGARSSMVRPFNRTSSNWTTESAPFGRAPPVAIAIASFVRSSPRKPPSAKTSPTTRSTTGVRAEAPRVARDSERVPVPGGAVERRHRGSGPIVPGRDTAHGMDHGNGLPPRDRVNNAIEPAVGLLPGDQSMKRAHLQGADLFEGRPFERVAPSFNQSRAARVPAVRHAPRGWPANHPA